MFNQDRRDAMLVPNPKLLTQLLSQTTPRPSFEGRNERTRCPTCKEIGVKKWLAIALHSSTTRHYKIRYTRVHIKSAHQNAPCSSGLIIWSRTVIHATFPHLICTTSPVDDSFRLPDSSSSSLRLSLPWVPWKNST